jgi:hypothetical protein
MSETPELTYTQSSSSLLRVASVTVLSAVAAPLDGAHGMDTRVVLERAYSPPLVAVPEGVELTTIRL